MKKIFLLIIFILAISFTYSQNVYEKGNIIKDTITIQEVKVSGSYTAVKETPFSFQNLTQKQIEVITQNSEPAVILSTTPSINHYSDNGLDIGYTYFRLRGIDQTRINSSLNGVNLNEPEDQGIYYNNYGNFLNSISSIQIIRGAGVTKGGNSTYGGSINFSSPEFSDTTNSDVSVTLGSYNTYKIAGGYNSKHFFINGSVAQSDGYRYYSGNQQYSIFYGAQLKCLKWYGFVGHQKNGMAWLGEPLNSIKANPRYNSNTPEETDDFLSIHNQLTWTKYNFTVTTFHSYINGWYDSDNAHWNPTLNFNDSMYRIALKSNWLGLNANYNFKFNSFNNNVGVNSYTYYRDHTGSTNSVEDYTNTGTKKEVSPYIKSEYKINNVLIYGDVQYRHNTFAYNGTVPFETLSYDFLNWSTGISIKTGTYTNVYYGLGQSHREPTRNDLFMGNDNYDSTKYNPTTPESVIDQELGVRFKNRNWSVESNLYYMKFKNEIVLNGEVGPNSILLHQNVDNSYRTGLEYSVTYLMDNGLEFKTLGNLSHNKIKEENELFNPVLTPNVILSGDIKYNLDKIGYFGFNVKYNGESYIDLSNEINLPAYAVLNTYFGFQIRNLNIKWNMNNIANKLILTNGIANYGSPLYFVMAGINGNVTLKYTF